MTRAMILLATIFCMASASRAAEPAKPKLPPLKSLFDYPLRDASVCVGGDGFYYLTGTTGHATWWKTNEGIRVWRSADLKTWTPVGLVWKIDDGKVYFVWQNGTIARLNDEMTELAETPRHLKPSNHGQVGFEGAFLTKINKQYYLLCADFIQGDYHCMIAQADSIYGPYGPRYLAVPHGGYNMLFKDKEGQWWATFFGNDAHAPFRERPGMLRIEFDAAGQVRPKG